MGALARTFGGPGGAALQSAADLHYRRGVASRLKTRKGTEADLERIKNEDIADCVDAEELRVVEGSAEVEGSYDPSGKTVLVLGDLSVAGHVNVEEDATLVVTGALRCKSLYLEGNLEVQGATEVAETIFGYYEGGVSDLRGAVAAKLLLIGNHDLALKKSQLRVEHHFQFDNFQRPRPRKLSEAAVREVLSDEAFRHLSDLLGFTEDASPDASKAQQLLARRGFLRSAQ